MRDDLTTLRTEMHGDLTTLRTEMREDLEGLRGEVRDGFGRLDVRIRFLEEKAFLDPGPRAASAG